MSPHDVYIEYVRRLEAFQKCPDFVMRLENIGHCVIFWTRSRSFLEVLRYKEKSNETSKLLFLEVANCIIKTYITVILWNEPVYVAKLYKIYFIFSR